MNFGDCPYCNEFLGMFEVPERTPAYTIVQCESCGKDVWYRLSRVDPQCWTIEDFEKNFIIDNENKKITERNPTPKIELPKEMIETYLDLVDDMFLNGDPDAIKPVGIIKFSKD